MAVALPRSSADYATVRTPGNGLGCTTGYAAPEALADGLFGGQRGLTQVADVWALGLVILQMFFAQTASAHFAMGWDTALSIGIDPQDMTKGKMVLDVLVAGYTFSISPESLNDMTWLRNRVPDLYDLLSKVSLLLLKMHT